MTNNRTAYLNAIVLLGALYASIVSAWASEGICTYAASGTGMGGTGVTSHKSDSSKMGGTGMGGTGIVAQSAEMGGTGMGGTGITLSKLQLAGKVISSSGHVEAHSNGRTRLVANGGEVCVGETIVTTNAGSIEIRMIDDAYIAVRPQTKLKIDKYAFNGKDSDASLITVIKGASRFVTGKLGKRHPQNDLVNTPNAIVGVLGTDHEVKVILPGEGGSYRSGTYDKVNQGITFIKTDKGGVDIHPNQAGFATSNTELPILLKDIPDFYNEVPSVGEDMSVGGHKEDKPSEGEHLSIEQPESHNDIEVPEAPEQHEVPELPEQPEVPELPSVPEAPEPSGS